jgi:hypothetical protein
MIRVCFLLPQALTQHLHRLDLPVLAHIASKDELVDQKGNVLAAYLLLARTRAGVCTAHDVRLEMLMEGYEVRFDVLWAYSVQHSSQYIKDSAPDCVAGRSPVEGQGERG